MRSALVWEKVHGKQHPTYNSRVVEIMGELKTDPNEKLKAFAEELDAESEAMATKRIKLCFTIIERRLAERSKMFFKYTDEAKAKLRAWLTLARLFAEGWSVTNLEALLAATDELDIMLARLQPLDTHITIGKDHLKIVQSPSKET